MSMHKFLNIEMEPRIGDGENWINGKFASLDSKCRKVTTYKCPCINVLNVEMEPRMGEGKTEPMESLENWINGKFTSSVSKCRKVTMHKCFKCWNGKFGKLNKRKICISCFFSTERSPHMNVLNVEMEPRIGDRENWTKGKFRKLNQQKICISGF